MVGKHMAYLHTAIEKYVRRKAKATTVKPNMILWHKCRPAENRLCPASGASLFQICGSSSNDGGGRAKKTVPKNEEISGVSIHPICVLFCSPAVVVKATRPNTLETKRVCPIQIARVNNVHAFALRDKTSFDGSLPTSLGLRPFRLILEKSGRETAVYSTQNTRSIRLLPRPFTKFETAFAKTNQRAFVRPIVVGGRLA